MAGNLKQIKALANDLLNDYQQTGKLNTESFQMMLNAMDDLLHDDIDFKEIVDNIDDSIFIADKDGYVLYVNPAYTQNTGIPPQDVLHKYVRDIVAEGVFSGGSTIPVMELKKKVFRLSTTYRSDPPRIGYTVGVPLFGHNGELKQIVVTSRPILTLASLKDDYSRFLEEANRYIPDKIRVIEPSAPESGKQIIGQSPQIKNIQSLIQRVAPTDATVLITGESGVGKEVFANEIYNQSKRKNKPFIKVNCAAIPAALLESELFGYEKGSFSGANTQGKKGLFEVAHKGTILLDEIGDMSMDLQVKLLRAIQNKEVFRIGGTMPIPLDLRIIAATNSNLKKKISEGAFRQDLYYRLCVIPMEIPPLRERKSDIAPLCTHFAEYFNKKHHTHIELNSRLIHLMESYSWPGNVRELENVIEYLIICHSGIEDVDEVMLRGLLNIDAAINLEDYSEDVTIAKSKASLEKKLIEETLKKSKNLKEAGQLLNTSASTVSRKIKQYGIYYPRSRSF